jgi:hypothetical protein
MIVICNFLKTFFSRLLKVVLCVCVCFGPSAKLLNCEIWCVIYIQVFCNMPCGLLNSYQSFEEESNIFG